MLRVRFKTLRPISHAHTCYLAWVPKAAPPGQEAARSSFRTERLQRKPLFSATV